MNARRLFLPSLISTMIATCLVAITLSPHSAAANDDDVKLAGDVLQVVIPVAGLGMTAYHRDLKGTGMLALSGVVMGGTTWALKVAIDRDRPEGKSGYSMPSGHAAVSAWGAGFIHRRYGFLPAIPAYLGAGYVAWSRVHIDYHREEEVVAGAAIGLLSSFLLTRRYEDEASVAFVPIVGSGFYGLRVSGAW